MAFDEATEQGVLDRRYEFVFEYDAGLPQGTAQVRHSGLRAARRRRLHRSGRRQLHRLGDGAGRHGRTPARCRSSACAAPMPSTASTASGRATATSAASPSLIDVWLVRNGYTAGRRARAVDPDLRGVLPVLSPGVPALRRRHRRGREHARHSSRVEELADRFRILRDADADALVWLGYGGMVVDFTVRARSSRSTGTRPGS